MRLLALDLSTKSGWALYEDSNYVESGSLEKVDLVNFNVNDDPNKQLEYPKNVMDGARAIARAVQALVHTKNPDLIVIENSVKGRNRHTQRLIEWFHFCVLEKLYDDNRKFIYMDPSEWRKNVNLRLTKEDKKNNTDVNKGKKRGKITRKHLSVRMANSLFNLKLKVKDNDEADAICLGWGYINRP